MTFEEFLEKNVTVIREEATEEEKAVINDNLSRIAAMILQGRETA